MNEEAKRSMIEWQEKLDKVTKDSNERITELQQKLTKVSNAPTKTSLACLRGTAHLSARDVHQHAQTFNLSGGAKRSASTLSCSWYLLLELWRKWAYKTRKRTREGGIVRSSAIYSLTLSLEVKQGKYATHKSDCGSVLVQSLQSNQEATELLENVRKTKDELQKEFEKLKVCMKMVIFSSW